MNNKIEMIRDSKDIKLTKYLVFISMLYMVVTIVPNIVLYRLVDVDNMVLPGGMFIFPLIYILTDVIAEVYGYKTARLLIWVSLLNNFIFSFLIPNSLSFQ